jgi:hypothetical protein
VIGRVRHVLRSKHESALAYWHGRYVVIDRDEDVARLAAVGVPWGRDRLAECRGDRLRC